LINGISAGQDKVESNVQKLKTTYVLPDMATPKEEEMTLHTLDKLLKGV
jgi:hypothetical protein